MITWSALSCFKTPKTRSPGKFRQDFLLSLLRFGPLRDGSRCNASHDLHFWRQNVNIVYCLVILCILLRKWKLFESVFHSIFRHSQGRALFSEIEAQCLYFFDTPWGRVSLSACTSIFPTMFENVTSDEFYRVCRFLDRRLKADYSIDIEQRGIVIK